MSAKKSKNIKSAQTTAIQLWYGENQSLLEFDLSRWTDLFRAKHPQAQVKKFIYNEATEEELAVALHQAINGGGLFTSKMLVIVKGVLAAEAKGSIGQLIQQACSQGSLDLVLVLVETKKIVWSKSLPKFLKIVEEAGTLKFKEYVNLSEHEVAQWITARMREVGGKFALGAARILAQAIGNNFIALDNEIAKLAAWRAGEEVRAVDIDLMVTPQLEDDVFAFIDAVGRRDIRLAQEALTRQFAQGNSPQSLVGLLGWHVRVLALVRESLDTASERQSARELAADLGLHPFVVTKTLQQIPYYSTERIVWLYGELSALDVKLKTSRTDPEVLFGLFLSKLSALKPVGS